MKNGRIYVCHTFYHVYISFLKEFALPESEHGNASIVLSKMSNDFGDIKGRILNSGYFKKVYEYDEKREDFFPELKKYKENKGNAILNFISRIRFTSLFAKLQDSYVPVNFSEYDDIYVFCDVDPIGLYLNKKKIPYHGMEDGLDCHGVYVSAVYDDRKFFKLKCFLSMKLNLIFMGCGYSKYCIDYEVNNVSIVKPSFFKYKEMPRLMLENELTEELKRVLISVFVRDVEGLYQIIDKVKENRQEKSILLLTEPLCSLDVRKQIFTDLISEYRKEGNVFIKIHPRDELDYSIFKNVFLFDKTVPMEVLNFIPGLIFDKVVGVFTNLGAIRFGKEKVKLGRPFMDKYEASDIHNHEDRMEEIINKRGR